MELQQDSMNNRFISMSRHIENTEKHVDDFKTNQLLISETSKQLDRGGLPMNWEDWCLTLAEAYGLKPRRVRRVLKKHGLGREHDREYVVTVEAK